MNPSIRTFRKELEDKLAEVRVRQCTSQIQAAGALAEQMVIDSILKRFNELFRIQI